MKKDKEQIDMIETDDFESLQNIYGLTDKQEEFAQQVLILGNYSGAYRAVYNAENMKANVVHVKASELASHGKVAVRIQELRRQAQERNNIKSDRVLAEYSYIAFGSIADLYDDSGKLKPFSDMTKKEKVLIKKVKYTVVRNDEKETRIVEEITLHDKLGALRDLAKHLGLFEADNEQQADNSRSLDELEALHQKKIMAMKEAEASLKDRGKLLEKELNTK